MPDLREQLQQLFQGRVCLMGLGNVAYGDDGLGRKVGGSAYQQCSGKSGLDVGSSSPARPRSG